MNDELKEKLSKLSNTELIYIVYISKSEYTDEAKNAAEYILKERRLDNPTEIEIQGVKEQYENSENTREASKYNGVEGFLFLFILNLVFFSPGITIIYILNGQESSLLLNIILLGWASFGVYIGIGLYRKHQKSVKLAKLFLMIPGVIGLLIIVFTQSKEGVREVIANFTWLLYLYKSKRVKATYNLDNNNSLIEILVSKTSICPRCGFNNDYDSEFCSECGINLKNYNSKNPNPEELILGKETKKNTSIFKTIVNKMQNMDKIYFAKLSKQWKYICLLTFFILIVTVFLMNRPLNPTLIYEREKNNIVSIYSSGGLLRSPIEGTGFVVDSSGKILTNYHVIRGAFESYAKFLKSDDCNEIRILGVDAKKDIALLKIEKTKLSKVILGNSDKTKTGSNCYVIGNPLGIERVISDGIVSNIVNSKYGHKLIQITAPVSHGNSGGPVYNEFGKVIGIAAISLSEGQNLNFIVPINFAKPLIANKKYDISLQEFTKNDANAYFYSGLENIKSKNYILASKRLYKSYELDSTFTDAYYWIGLCALLNDENDVAKNWFQSYLQLEQNNPEKEEYISKAKYWIKEIDIQKEKEIESLMRYYMNEY